MEEEKNKKIPKSEVEDWKATDASILSQRENIATKTEEEKNKKKIPKSEVEDWKATCESKRKYCVGFGSDVE
jgi:hypothetical protein